MLLFCAAWPDGLIPDANHQAVDIRRLQLLAHAIDFRQIADRPDSHAMPHIVVHCDALHLGVDALQCSWGCTRSASARLR